MTLMTIKRRSLTKVEKIETSLNIPKAEQYEAI